MKGKKGLMVLISVLIIGIIIVLVIINALKKKKENNEFIMQNNPTLSTYVGIKKLDNENEFFTVEGCINKYLKTLDKKDSNGVFNLLNDKYIEKNGINNSNVMQKSYQLENGFEEFFAKDIYYKEISYDKEFQYYIFGEILGEGYNTIQTVYIIANLDYENMTFNVTLPKKIEIDESEYLKEIENIKNNNSNEFINVENQEDFVDIKLNQYNEFKQNVSQNSYALNHYLKNYTIMAVYYPDIAYNLLDEEYRNNRFGDIDNYKQYVLENKYTILNSTIKDFKISEKEGYHQYIILDTNENYYIFKVTDIMDYTIIGDFYTIEIEEFINNYDNRNVQERVAINIQKVVSALNNKDYQYVYNKLDEEFKANKYPTLESFKNYMSTLIIGSPQVSFNEFRNEGEVYIYNITLEATSASAGDPVDMQIIMKLKENRDFVMSFSVK